MSISATRGIAVCERLDELGIMADEDGISTHQSSREPAKTIALALDDVAIFLHDDGCHAVSFNLGSYRYNLTFRPRNRNAIIEGTVIHTSPDVVG